VIYYDLKSHEICLAQHVEFSEGMRDYLQRPHNALLFDAAISATPVDPEDLEFDADALDTTDSPFEELVTVEIPIQCDSPTLGMEIRECANRLRACIGPIDCGLSIAARLKRCVKDKLVSSYVVEIEGTPVYTVGQVQECLQKFASANPRPTEVRMVVAPETKDDNRVQFFPSN
jgi:hypothetical protein